jgi:UDP-N-acetylmuramate dehydrogenase
MLIEENKPLAPFTTFGIGGPARWFVEAVSEDEIAEAATWAGERGVALFVLGGGSNLLVSDAGFNGLVLRVAVRGILVPQSDRELIAVKGTGFSPYIKQAIDEGALAPEETPQ